MTPIGLNLGLRLGSSRSVGVAPESPVALASAAVLDTSFVANWEAVTGDTSYERRYSCS